MVIHRALSAISIAACCVLVSTAARAATKTAMMQITVEVRPSCGASTRSDPHAAVAFDCTTAANSVPFRRDAVPESPAPATARSGKPATPVAPLRPAVIVTEF
jgi:hypothetical protein